ncbi:hypothetical protein Golob_002587 [Gossypium lobatum]|uniref:Uncharacterized protein n=1 Tax=Gossypium lobatum TaxID=34289 RepID=A0A7J8N5W2_9ROSI|nr:hypothetical protein [Gossypium lobatum]
MESCGSIEEGCTTPKHLMLEAFQCPPPPRKKSRGESKREPPKNGYFQPPDLDSLFTMKYHVVIWETGHGITQLNNSVPYKQTNRSYTDNFTISGQTGTLAWSC